MLVYTYEFRPILANQETLTDFHGDETKKDSKMADSKTLTSNSVATQLFFLGYNYIIKKKICLVLPEKEISNHRN